MLEFNATFFVAFFSFILFMLIMNSILYKPLARIAQERENLINSNYSNAKLNTEKSENLRTQQSDSISKAQSLAKNNFNKKIEEYKSIKNSILDSSKNLAKKNLEIAQAQLNGDEREAKLLLKPKIVELANLVASKVLGYQSDIKEVD